MNRRRIIGGVPAPRDIRVFMESLGRLIKTFLADNRFGVLGGAPMRKFDGNVKAQAEGAFVFFLPPYRRGLLFLNGVLETFQAENGAMVPFDHGFLAVPIAAAKVTHDDNSIGVLTLHLRLPPLRCSVRPEGGEVTGGPSCRRSVLSLSGRSDGPFGGENGESHDRHKNRGGDEAVGIEAESVLDKDPRTPDQKRVDGAGANRVKPVAGEKIDGRVVGADFKTHEEKRGGDAGD